MTSSTKIRSIILHIFVPSFIGGVFGFALFYAADATVDFRFKRALKDTERAPANIALSGLDADEFFYEPLSLPVPKIPEEGKAVVADLSLMQVRLYDNGKIMHELPIVSKGKPGSFWETPTGEYRVLSKEESHFSSIGEVYMPYSIGFFGNFFIHGWPTYPSGRAVAEGFSGGCIRMQTKDAKIVYDFVEIKTPIIVVESEETQVGELTYLELNGREPPKISAKAYLVADLDNNFVFLEKNRAEQLPIASITKLMTAIISLEAINQEREIIVRDADLDIYGDSGSLVKDESFIAKDLLVPLLLSSSNDAAFALARVLGRERFVELMNQKARALGFGSTVFTDPSGLEMGNVSTANELLYLQKYIRDNRAPLLKMSSKRTVSLDTNKTTHKWYNFNWKRDDDEFVGGKVGFTNTAGHTMAALFKLPLAEFSDRSIGVVVLGSDDEERDVRKIVEWVKSSFVYGSTKTVQSARTRGETLTNSQEVSLLFVGDIMIDRGVESKIHSAGKGNFIFPFDRIKSILEEPDITFGNLEGPISDRGTKRGSIYSFRMEPEAVKALYDTGFDVLSVANNHIGDYGREAMEDTFRRLRRAGIAYTGAGWNSVEALSPAILERSGVKVGFLGFSDVGPSWLKAGEVLSGIALAGAESVESAVRQAREKADILVVSFHFGEEYETTSRARQRELAHTAIDAGAKIVVGHHPHVAQEVERYKEGVIAYSLGNFIFDQAFSPETKRALMLTVKLKGAAIDSFEAIPIVFNENFQPAVDD